jgi:glutaminyl-peptide cyclotransferase
MMMNRTSKKSYLPIIPSRYVVWTTVGLVRPTEKQSVRLNVRIAVCVICTMFHWTYLSRSILSGLYSGIKLARDDTWVKNYNVLQEYRRRQTWYTMNFDNDVARHNIRVPYFSLYSGMEVNALAPIITTSRTLVGRYKLLQTVPHDTNAFTQGLSVFQVKDRYEQSISVMVEGTGRYGSSELRHVNIETGEVIQRHQLRNKYFGEGITNYQYYEKCDRQPSHSSTSSSSSHRIGDTNPKMRLKQRIVQITWQEQKAFVYDVLTNFSNDCIDRSITTNNLFSLKPVYNFTFNTTTNEGWGITYRADKNVFYVTDGSSYIHTWNATTFEEINVQQVRQKKLLFVGNNALSKPTTELNDIQWDPVTKTLLANVWYKNYIIRIDPETGHVLTIYNLKQLYKNRSSRCDVLNGIALTQNFESLRNNEIWVTGKFWPTRYRIQLIG